MSGTLYTDTLTLGDGVVIPEQSIGVDSEGDPPSMHGADGVLGLGPVAVTKGSLVNDPETTIPTVIDNLFTWQGAISQSIISFFFSPSLYTRVTYGTTTFGGIDPGDHTGSITYT